MDVFVVLGASGFQVATTAAIIGLVAIWLALVLWTYTDARRRTQDPFLVGCATVAALFPLVGTICYLLVRPPEVLDDARERQLAIEAAEATLAEQRARSCENCGGHIEPTFLRCPNCLTQLRSPCPACARPVDLRWVVCPYCEIELQPAPRAPTRAANPRSRRRGQGAPPEVRS